MQSKNLFRFVEFKSGFFDNSGRSFFDFRDGLGIVGISFEIVSNLTDVISDNIVHFKTALGWRMAAALLESSLASDAVNIHTNTNRGIRMELAHEYKKKYQKELERITRPLLLRLENTPVIRGLRHDDIPGISIGSLLN
jgi:hypothetical protein